MENEFWANKHIKKLINLKNFKEAKAKVLLIFGPKSVGKFTLAKIIAKTIFCSKSARYCDKCRDCLLISRENHPDLMILQSVGKKSEKIHREQAQNMRKSSETSSYFTGKKVFIVEEAQNLTHEAQNSLLKTLEEPNSQTVFILTSSAEKLILGTILSRCQKIKLSHIPAEEMRENLKKKHSVEEAELIARYSFGRAGIAQKLSENPKNLDEILSEFKEIRKIVKSEDIVYLFEKANLFASKKTQKNFLNFLEIFFRDLLHLKLGLKNYLVNINEIEPLQKLSEKYSFLNIFKIIKLIEKIKINLSQNVNPKFALENLMLNLKG